MAKTIYGEARHLGLLDRLAVGAVIRERVLRPGWWGEDWESVCKSPGQFACWNEDNPNREKVLRSHIDDVEFFYSFLTLGEYVKKHMTDEDVKELFGVDKFPTHYHRTEESYPEKEWRKKNIVIRVPWNSGFVFYRGIEGTPEGKG